MSKVLKFEIRPFPAVRSNRNSWTPSVVKYHSLMNDLRKEVLPYMETVKDMLKSGNYGILFTFAIPNSYSKKKARETQGKPYLQKPDIDNLFKSFVDTVFYKSDDSWVYKMNAKKVWWCIWEESSITIYEL